jgi:hypothetical protein
LAGKNDLPKRVIAGISAKLSRAAHGITYDAIHDEIVITNPFAQAILTFRGSANGDEAPVRIIQGPHTKYAGSDRVDVDPVHDEILVADDDRIMVFSRTATGDVAPIRVIQGPATTIRSDGPIAVDPVNNLIVMYDSGGGEGNGGFLSPGYDAGSQRSNGALRIFNRTDNGDVKPVRVIEGPKVGLFQVNQIQVYGPKGWIFVSLRPAKDNYFAGVWSVNDNGDVPPRWVLGNLPDGVKPGRTVAFDPVHKEVFGTAYGAGEAAVLLRYHFPEIF